VGELALGVFGVGHGPNPDTIDQVWGNTPGLESGEDQEVMIGRSSKGPCDEGRLTIT
jgi:hypothetical protein